MNKIMKMAPYLIMNAAAFYLLPIAMQDTGTAIMVLLVGTPIICLITSLLYGNKNGINFIYPIIIAVLFVPTIFIFYNHTAWIYSGIYGALSLVGNVIGKLLQRAPK